MYNLSMMQGLQIDAAKLKTGVHLGTGDAVCQFVLKYEQDPDQFTNKNAKIRYEASKRGFTLGELEILLGLPSGAISNAAQNPMPKVDAHLSYFFEIPVDELRVIKIDGSKTRTAKILKVASLLRKLADELETI